MAKTIAQIRYTIEQRVKDTIDNQDVIDWCNDAQSELLMIIEVPDAAQIVVMTDSLAYPEPANIKRINRMWLQSERDSGMDRDISLPFRIYNGQIIFERLFSRDDTLHIEFYRNLTFFETIDDVLDLDDRYSTLYTSYGTAQYYDQPNVIKLIGDQQSKRQYDKHYGRHMVIRDQIAAQFTLQTQPSTIKEVY